MLVLGNIMLRTAHCTYSCYWARKCGT